MVFPAARNFSLSLTVACAVLCTSIAANAASFSARSWQSEDGLPSNVVRGIAQARDGYLWVGTAEGLARFDGQRFSGFTGERDARLARLPTRTLYALGNGEVWITTTNGVLLRGWQSHLQEVTLPPAGAASPKSVSQVLMGDRGEVLVVRGPEDVYRVVDGKVSRVAEPTTTVKRLLQQDAAAEPERGNPVSGDPVLRLRRARGGFWESKPGAGLTHTDAEGRVEPVVVQSELPSEIRAMTEDREGNLWLAAGTQGLWQLRPSRVEMLTTADGLSDRAAVLVMEDRTGALWAAPQAGGLDRLVLAINSPARHYEFSSSGPRRPASAFLETRAGVLWSAARDGQVHMVKEGVFSPAFPDDRRASKVMAMVEDQQGRIWLGGRNGLSVLDGAELQSVELGATETITALVRTSGAVWAGTESGRVFPAEKESGEPAPPADAFAQQPISALLPDSDGSFWVGTMGGGLFHLHAGRVRPLGPMMSEVDPRITCVLDDHAGYLWIGTLGGICRADKAKLLGAPSAASDSTLVLDRSDGLLTRECTRGGQPAGWRGRDGTLYFSTGNGVACVHPERLSLNSVPPPVVIEEASAGGHTLASGAASVQAGPGRSRLVFRYTALSFTAPERVRFRTQLEGLDETWRDAGRVRTMAYEAVPPGRYRFHVVAENGDGVWNETGATLGVEVLPHFWETRWFQLGIALLAGAFAVAIGALVTRARMQAHLARLEAQTSRAKERARIAQDLHDDLGASLTEISLLANLAAEERGPESATDGTLPEVAAKAQALVGALDEIVWAVNPRHDTLRSLAEYLAAFGGKFLGHAGITLRRDVPRELPEISLDTERRHSLFLAVREALNNAVKHSGASEIWLRLHLDGGRLEIVIEDNGRGFDPAAVGVGAGDGLGNLRSRLEGIGGTCRIESQPGAGTKVMLSLPVG